MITILKSLWANGNQAAPKIQDKYIVLLCKTVILCLGITVAAASDSNESGMPDLKLNTTAPGDEDDGSDSETKTRWVIQPREEEDNGDEYAPSDALTALKILQGEKRQSIARRRIKQFLKQVQDRSTDTSTSIDKERIAKCSCKKHRNYHRVRRFLRHTQYRNTDIYKDNKEERKRFCEDKHKLFSETPREKLVSHLCNLIKRKKLTIKDVLILHADEKVLEYEIASEVAWIYGGTELDLEAFDEAPEFQPAVELDSSHSPDE